jgi:hypothetical protein
MSRDVAVFALERTCFAVAEEKHEPAIVNISVSLFVLTIRDSYRGDFGQVFTAKMILGASAQRDLRSRV